MTTGHFYFAWTGGAMNPVPPVSFTGNTHGSIAQTIATTGDLIGGTLVENVSDIGGLVPGQLYGIAGPGIPPGTTFTYFSGNAFSLSQAAAPASDVTLTITEPVIVAQVTGSASGTTLNLDFSTGLTPGQLYGVTGSGIPLGATFVYGGNQASLSQNAATNGTVALVISGLPPNDPFTVDGVSLAGLTPGGQYLIAGPGIPAGTSFIAPASGDALTIDQAATASGINLPLVALGPMVATAAWSTANLVDDEHIFAIELAQHEGEFATLKIEVLNPRIGLLAAGRNIWCWLSWDSGPGGIIPLFNGRLVGIPQSLAGETVRLQFVACPNDYNAQKEAVAAGMRVLPWWDPVWFTDKLFDADTVLETQPALWHVDRTSLGVTTSNINVGEDGTLVVHEADHFYDALEVSYGQPPLNSVDVEGSVSWTQEGEGTIDITSELVAAFAHPVSVTVTATTYGNGTIGAVELSEEAQGGDYRVSILAEGSGAILPGGYPTSTAFIVTNPRGQVIGSGAVGAQFSGGGITFTLSPGTTPFTAGDQFLISVSTSGGGAGIGGASLIRTLTGDGLKSSWPAPGRSIGSGWSVGDGASIIDVSQLGGTSPFNLTVNYVPGFKTQLPLGGLSGLSLMGYQEATIAFPVSVFSVYFPLRYEAARDRTETVRFALVADIQPLVTDPGTASGETISLRSQAVAQAVDPGGALPIGDLRRNSYFQTDRGTASYEFLVLLARAKLLARARAVKISFEMNFAPATQITCRMNVELHDRRLPGGVATGKVESYELLADERGGRRAKVTIGCTIGNGIAQTGTAGVPSYSSGYADGVEAAAGAQIALIPGEIACQSLDDFAISDDGVDLTNMTPQSVIESLIVTNGFERQVHLVTTGTLVFGIGDPADPAGMLMQNATGIELDLVPLSGSFHSEFAPSLTLLSVPKTIDLAAPEASP